MLLPEKIFKVKDSTILSQIMVELTLSVKLNDEDCTITLCSKMLSPCLEFSADSTNLIRMSCVMRLAESIFV